MTMTNDELRALADCLNDPNAMQRTARRKAADYLRAQADAQPVATLTLLDDMGIQIDFRKSFTLLPGQTFFLYTHPAPAAPHYAMLDSHRRLVEQAIQSAEHPSGMSTHDGKAHIDASVLRRMLAIIDSSPAAPQAEEPMWKRLRDAGFTKRDNRITCDECGKRFTPQFLPIHKCEPIDPHMIAAEDRFPDEPQAEPKREPLTYEQLVSVCYTYRHDFGSLDPDEQELVIEEGGRWAKAFGIGGSDAE